MENYKEYKKAFNRVKKLIKNTLETENQINEYVPNSHIAERFVEILELLEFELLYNPTTLRNRPIIGVLDLYLFDSTIHEVYQKLRRREDYIRNIYKLVQIRHQNYWKLYKQVEHTVSAKELRKIRKSS